MIQFKSALRSNLANESKKNQKNDGDFLNLLNFNVELEILLSA